MAGTPASSHGGGTPTDPGTGKVWGSDGAGGALGVLPPGYELGYAQVTANVNVASTTEATGTLIVTAPAIVFDGAPVICEFFAPSVNLPTAAAGNSVVVCLFEGATEIGRIAAAQTPSVTGQDAVPMYGQLRFTPASGSHTYKVTAFASSVTGTPLIAAGLGGTGAAVAAFVRLTKV